MLIDVWGPAEGRSLRQASGSASKHAAMLKLLAFFWHFAEAGFEQLSADLWEGRIKCVLLLHRLRPLPALVPSSQASASHRSHCCHRLDLHWSLLRSSLLDSTRLPACIGLLFGPCVWRPGTGRASPAPAIRQSCA